MEYEQTTRPLLVSDYDRRQSVSTSDEPFIQEKEMAHESTASPKYPKPRRYEADINNGKICCGSRCST
ncbi:hypothetical protein GALMADRAFT_222442 [Galerina marginata CBS 339.88]|uniref:Uncharacterized protein n=1 Tax=Galerina marginata (strain CBS 339.88) TaxID=685588 RepID=A0A067TPF4_GALM3|nr:hypothetical protein GALMADRAFT_222442 [Galerina marginata CBS 339.88]